MKSEKKYWMFEVFDNVEDVLAILEGRAELLGTYDGKEAENSIHKARKNLALARMSVSNVIAQWNALQEENDTNSVQELTDTNVSVKHQTVGRVGADGKTRKQR